MHCGNILILSNYRSRKGLPVCRFEITHCTFFKLHNNNILTFFWYASFLCGWNVHSGQAYLDSWMQRWYILTKRILNLFSNFSQNWSDSWLLFHQKFLFICLTSIWSSNNDSLVNLNYQNPQIKRHPPVCLILCSLINFWSAAI